ncbi:unnamed protein product [Litomosoides sigmodontis]|uniref:Uncharacterized protein n=1 Tax=Litomosoides sigmodontis TaxID=42156 RepID=A0A3P6SK53_LITSI|nr:unnamed protein product [Litomosoides sigmodontis]
MTRSTELWAFPHLMLVISLITSYSTGQMKLTNISEFEALEGDFALIPRSQLNVAVADREEMTPEFSK